MATVSVLTGRTCGAYLRGIETLARGLCDRLVNRAEPTYEGLKRSRLRGGFPPLMGAEPTYEGLKRVSVSGARAVRTSAEPTYEGLKRTRTPRRGGGPQQCGAYLRGIETIQSL